MTEISDLADGPARPSLGLLRDLTDEHVLAQLMAAETLTRAEIAARTGISKPTISESVRRLESDGVIAESGVPSGRQTGRRGPSGTFYRLATSAGVALVQAAGPAGVVTELRDLRGGTIAEDRRVVAHPTTSADLGPVMVAGCRAVLAGSPGPVLATSISVANPVDARTGALVRLPDSPFLLDELNPAELLGAAVPDLAGSSLLVDNDVNWAALAERQSGCAADLDDFAYCYLGPGLGLGLLANGRLIRGHRGLAGELAYLLTEGPDGRSRPLLECFADLGLLCPDSWEIDVTRLTSVLGTSSDPGSEAVVRALAGALGSIVALTNPQALVIAQDWGWDGDLIAPLSYRLAEVSAVPVEVRAAALTDQASLLGARTHAVRTAQQVLLRRP